MGIRTSAEPSFAGGQPTSTCSAPAKHSLTGGRRIPKSATPSRSPLTGGEHQLPLRFASPEQARDGDPYLRRTLVRRRTACIRMLSSGKHSLTGGRRIPKSPTPSRSPLTGVENQLPLRFASPEQARDGDPYLRRTLVRRRTACVRMLSSDKHSLTGGRRIPKSATPSRRALTGGAHQLPLRFALPEQKRIDSLI